MKLPARPVYYRLRVEIIGMILEGEIAEGQALPSVRAFAAERGANPLTVAKAYQTFQDDGIVTVRRGVGMFVLPGAVAKLRTITRKRFIDNEWPEIAHWLRLLDIDAAELLERIPG